MPSSSSSLGAQLQLVAQTQQSLQSMNDALNDIRQLLQQKETLQADVAALKREKAQLTQDVQALRGDSHATANDTTDVGAREDADNIRYNQYHYPFPAERPVDETTNADVAEVKKRSNSMPTLLGISDDDDDSQDSSNHNNNNNSNNLNAGFSSRIRRVSSRSSRRHRSSSRRVMSSEEAPQHFFCPLTLEIMKHPMQQKGTNKNYERGAILEWIYFGKATCPLTRAKLHPGDFIENRLLKQEIQEWRQQHGLAEDASEEGEEELDTSDLVQKLTPQQEREQVERMSRFQAQRRGSTTCLAGIRDRILQKRDERVRRASRSSSSRLI